MNPYEERNTQRGLAMKASGCKDVVEYLLMTLRDLHLTHQVTWQYSIWSTYHIKAELPENKLDIVIDMSGNLMHPVHLGDDEKTEFKDLFDLIDYLHSLKIEKTYYSYEDVTQYLKDRKES